jgi:hypothetical protein
MQERATLLDGAVEIESEPGAGTLITVTIPLRQPGHALPTATNAQRMPSEAPRVRLSPNPSREELG